jgi:hypothetical protein
MENIDSGVQEPPEHRGLPRSCGVSSRKAVKREVLIEARLSADRGSDPEPDAVLSRGRPLDRLRRRYRGAGGLDRGPMRDVAIESGGELRLVVDPVAAR